MRQLLMAASSAVLGGVVEDEDGCRCVKVYRSTAVQRTSCSWVWRSAWDMVDFLRDGWFEDGLGEDGLQDLEVDGVAGVDIQIEGNCSVR